MKRYHGDRTIDGTTVTVDGRDLAARHDLKPCSQDFEWGYEGVAPAQLSLAILADHFEEDQRALSLHEPFMKAVVANFTNEWEMTSADVDRALANIA